MVESYRAEPGFQSRKEWESLSLWFHDYAPRAGDRIEARAEQAARAGQIAAKALEASRQVRLYPICKTIREHARDPGALGNAAELLEQEIAYVRLNTRGVAIMGIETPVGKRTEAIGALAKFATRILEINPLNGMGFDNKAHQRFGRIVAAAAELSPGLADVENEAGARDPG